jgi:hypothetical protein
MCTRGWDIREKGAKGRIPDIPVRQNGWMLSPPMQMLLVMLARWIDWNQPIAIEYCQAPRNSCWVLTSGFGVREAWRINPLVHRLRDFESHRLGIRKSG